MKIAYYLISIIAAVGLCIAGSLLYLTGFLSPALNPKLIFGEGNYGYLPAAQFSSDGKTVLAGTKKNQLALWDIATGNPIRKYMDADLKSTKRIDSVSFSPDNKFVLACGQDMGLTMWDKESGRQVNIFSQDQCPVQCFAFTPDGIKVLTVDFKHQICLWELSSGKMLQSGSIYPSYVSSFVGEMAYSKNGKFFILFEGSDISTWDALQLEMIQLSGRTYRLDGILWPTEYALLGSVLAPDGDGILSGSRDGKIIETEIGTGIKKRSFNLELYGLKIYSLTLSSSGDKLMAGSIDGEIRLFSFPECKEIKRFYGFGRPIFSPDGNLVLTFTKQGKMMLWECE